MILGQLTSRANELQEALDSITTRFGRDECPRKRVRVARRRLAADVAELAREQGLSAGDEATLLSQLQERAWARAHR